MASALGPTRTTIDETDPMHDPRPKETKGVPWGDHNETASGAPETRREEYGDADPSQDADERAADHSTERDDRSPSDTGTESNDEESSWRNRADEDPEYDL